MGTPRSLDQGRINRASIQRSSLALGFDGGEQPRLRGGQRHLDALGGQPVEPRNHGKEVGSQAGMRLATCGVNDIGAAGGGWISGVVRLGAVAETGRRSERRSVRIRTGQWRVGR